MNQYVKYYHFKMTTLEFILDLVTPNCYMASIDLKDAYFAIHIAVDHRNYLCFISDGKLYQFCCLPFGLTSAPRIFTKILKPPMSILRDMGHQSSAYIDNIWMVIKIYKEILTNVSQYISFVWKARVYD